MITCKWEASKDLTAGILKSRHAFAYINMFSVWRMRSILSLIPCKDWEPHQNRRKRTEIRKVCFSKGFSFLNKMLRFFFPRLNT